MAKEDVPTALRPSAALQRALQRLHVHPQVVGVTDPVWDTDTEHWGVEVEFRIELPSRQKALGETPSGIRARECVRFWFPHDFPCQAPIPTLRTDFPGNVPHLQPWTFDERPVPCISDIPLGELLLSEGADGLGNQMSDWLERAARETHNDAERGWEPARRDGLSHWLIADPTELRQHATSRGGALCQSVEYVIAPGDSPFGRFLGLDTRQRCTLNASDLRSSVNGVALDNGAEGGRTLLLLAWPGKEPSGQPCVTEDYFPDTVCRVSDLLDTAERLHCRRPLSQQLQRVRSCWPETGNPPRALVVVLLARRPFPVASTDSCYELFPYVVDARGGRSGMLNGDCTARPMGHLDRITPMLLARLSGTDECKDTVSWTLIGAGSVGSQIAVHLARAGCAPEAVIDEASPRPHNLARHALFPLDEHIPELEWMSSSKAERLARDVRTLGAQCSAFPETLERQMEPDGKAGKLWSSNTQLILNATASLGVRERLARATGLPAPVLECALFAEGTIAVVTMEGRPRRNPNTNDLMAECYVQIAGDPVLAKAMFAESPTIVRQHIGEGCGSPTMVMPNTRISLAASGMGEYVRKQAGSPESASRGHLLVGSIANDGMSITWRSHEVGPMTTVRPSGHRDWEIRIHDRAVRKIDAAIGTHPHVETGGVLIGRVSEFCRTINVVDVLDAPADSTRSRSEFVLGTQGLRAALDERTHKTNGAIYCVGTWHNHLSAQEASPTDRATARAVAVSRSVPTALLIRTPEAYHALLADQATDDATGRCGEAR